MISAIMFKKGMILLLLVFGSALAGKGWHWAKDGFSIRRTQFPLGEKSRAPFDPTIAAALSQTYRYLGRGHQCYAFESADGQYVLKLPRYDRYLVPFWLRACRFSFLDSYREELRLDKEKRLRFLLTSFGIAFDELREETALLCLHLGESDIFRSKTKIVDRLRRSYEIDLDKSAFILQRKKPLMMPVFEKSLKEGDRKAAKEILDAFLAVVAVRAGKGIFNKDPSFLRNFGYDGEGVQIDIGSFYRKPSVDSEEAFAPSFLQTVGHVQNWLAEVDPEIGAWFESRTKEIASR